MAAWFAIQALWWGYRAGATLGRGYLDWQAAQHGTTLEEGFKNAKLKAQFGQLNAFEAALVQFVEFNNRFAWTDFVDFAVDTSAVATAGAGLAAKIGLGKRIATVLGVKAAGPEGVFIDAMIDVVGSLLQGGKTGIPGNPVGAVKGLMNLFAKTGSELAPVVKAAEGILTATSALGSIVTPFLGIRDIPSAVGAVPQLVTALPRAIDALTNLVGSIFNFWGQVEPLLPERPPLGEPGSRNLLRELRGDVPRPREVWLTPLSGDPPPTPEGGFKPPPGVDYEEWLHGGMLPKDIRKFIPIIVPPPPIGPVTDEDRLQFSRRARNSGGASDLRRILEELKR